MRKKLLAIALTATMLFSFAACGGGTQESKKDEKKELELVDSGYGIVNIDSDVYMYWGATVKNPNKDYALEYPTINITAKDSDGKVITTEEQTLFTIAPEDTVSYGFQLDCNGKKPDKVEFKTDSGDFIEFNEETMVRSSNLKVSNTDKTTGDFGEVTFTGEIENSSENDLDQVAVTVIAKKGKKIVFGSTTFVDNLGSKDKKAFELTEYDIPEHDSFEVYAQSWM